MRQAHQAQIALACACQTCLLLAVKPLSCVRCIRPSQVLLK